MIIALQTLVFFRQSLLSALDRFLRPYYKRLTLTFSRYSPEDEEEEEEVFAEFDEEKGVIFFPPVYSQRYAAVSDCLMDERWSGKLEKVVDLGYHDMSFIKYLKELPGVRCILGVDIESIPLRCSSDLLGCEDYAPKREHPLQVTLFQGNAADPDYRLIGCDAVVAIEMIEHMLPHDLERLVHTVFGFIKPWIAVFTTPNSDFNVLFKSMESNGYRRCDHFFEWSREQFNDWCSNIVCRYPQFEVTCQGVGPGPPGTDHLGCCSQLALFINKNYVKQQDLYLNSLALVSNVPSPQNVAEMVGGWESPITETENILCPQENMESLTDFLYSNKQSCVTIVIATPPYSIESLEYSDKMSQCNLDTEIGKSFLMFNDEEMCFSVLVPRRKIDNKIYEIEDVTSRLNCTTFQVKKFSKTTQNLMAKNRVDSLVHTREVVNEIKHLTKMLNFNRDTLTDRGENGHIWSNINWGENAPYWNQYYKTVREYNYPFEVKSDEGRIIDLISEEINRLIDGQCDEEFSTDVNKLEIPIENLMRVVRHITSDVDKVKDILQWNGYEVEGDIVIHSRLIVDSASVGSCEEDWPENDTLSDLDTTDVHSTTLSDGSTMVPDYHGRCLRRALDKKVRTLRAMLSADEDITTELDRVVCRLMKLALRTSNGKQAPPPARWMQCKLLDLLTLTEKAISRRKRYYLENFAFPAIAYGQKKTKRIFDITKMKKENHTAKIIMDKYNHLIEETNGKSMFDFDFGFEDDLIDHDENFESNDSSFPSRDVIEDRKFTQETTESLYLQNNLELVPYNDENVKTISSSEQSTSNGERYRYQKPTKRNTKTKDRLDKKPRKRSHSKIAAEKNSKCDDKHRSKKSKTSLVKKMSHVKANATTRIYSNRVVNEYSSYGIKSKRVIKENKKLHPTASKPIPESLIELCHPELVMQTNIKEFNYTMEETRYNGSSSKNTRSYKDVAATEESILIDIVMDDMEETIALRRSIGTEPDNDITAIEQEIYNGNVTNIQTSDSLHNKLQMDSETTPSKTIFLYDINEPSTSKGVRHISMDVQCGTDTTTPACSMRTPSVSVTRMPKIFNNGIKIEDSLTNLAPQNSEVFDSGTTHQNENFGPVCYRLHSPNIFAKGIKIEDSIDDLKGRKNNFGTSTKDDERDSSPTSRSTKIRIKDSFPAFADSDKGSSPRRKCSGIISETISDRTKTNDAHQVIHPRMRASSKRFIGIKIRDSTCDLRSRKSIDFGTSPIDFAEDYVTISPKSKSPDAFCKLKFDNSLANVLGDINAVKLQGDNKNKSSVRSESQRKKLHDNVATKNTNSLDTLTDLNGMKMPKTKSTTILNFDIVSPTTHEISGNSFENETSKILTPRTRSPTKKHRLKTSFAGANAGQMADTGTCTGDINFAILKKNLNTDTTLGTVGHRTTEFGTTTESESQDLYDFPSSNLKKCQSIDIQTYNDIDYHNNTLTLKTRCFGFKVKDTDENVVKKVEFSTNRVDMISEGRPFIPPTELESSTKTELLKSVSSRMKTEDSSSEFCGSNYCSSPNPLQVTSDYGIKQFSSREMMMEDKDSPMKIMRRKLSCGGVHIHSFKEKQNSEDIFFQGEWQRQIPKFIKKQSQVNTYKKQLPVHITKKPLSKKSGSKDQKQLTKPVKNVEIKIEPRKPVYVRNIKTNRIKQETANKTDQIRKVTLPNLVKAVKANNKNITKVSSKIGTSSITSKNSRGNRIPKKNITIAPTPIKRDCDIKPNLIKRQETLHKSYLPSYLRKKKYISEHNNLDSSYESDKTTVKVNNEKNDSLIVHNNKDKVKSDLLKYQNDVHNNISYLVFRNEIENMNMGSNENQTADNANRAENSGKKRNSNKRSSSPRSMNSSACSSPDSVATVKAMTTWSKLSTRRHSTSSNKSSVATTDSEAAAAPTVRNRKFIKRSKTNRKTENKELSNKENIPDTSKVVNADSENLQNVKSAFFGQNKNVFLAQYANDSGLALNGKHQTSTKSNVKIPTVETAAEKKRPKTATITKRKSFISDDSSNNEEIKIQDSFVSENSNKVLLLGPYQDHSTREENVSQATKSEEQVNVVKVVDSNLLTEWLESGDITSTKRESTESAILAAMRQIVEERLDFISNSVIDSIISLDTTNTSFEDCHDLDDTSSLKSYKTVVPCNDADFNQTLKSDIENAMNRSFDGVADEMSAASFGYETDTDLLSFKSITSTRFSDYFLAEEQINAEGTPSNAHDNSVRDIFERKDLTLVQNPPGAFAVQAFSGFSMNVEPVVGDQPDYVNLVDSETGSIAVNVARQTASEELFVSGRSSESYESCLIDEDAVVPNWLFNIISQQQSIDEEEEEDHQELMPLPMPIVEPVYDVNGNAVEPGVNLGAGAGDGRGMHSDHSQDSSGRGSSLSSTDTSSEQQSESILIDPSAFAAQFELLHEPISSSVAVTALVVPMEPSDANAQGNENETVSPLRTELRIPINPLLVSDNEADVSSLDTDVPDSSDN